MKIKIIGAGSIGNHMAHASISLGHNVVMCDIDEKALLRTKKNIYPSRYGKWDDKIELFKLGQEPKNCFDIIIIGTPPHTHIDLALIFAEEKPKAILVEKPLCEPYNKKINKLQSLLNKYKIKCFVGYNHCLSKSVNKFLEIAKKNQIGEPLTLDVEFREHWRGIFKAHPWLQGPEDTYLGFSKKGGGATGEHSHAINLWVYISEQLGFGKIEKINSLVSYKEIKNKYLYDELCLVNLKTSKNYIGRVVQDVITYPTKKSIKLIGLDGVLELIFSFKGNDDIIIITKKNKKKILNFKKTRPEDFKIELRHIEKILKTRTKNNIISLENGIKTMKIIENIYKDKLG
jgi:predicted dehydrogenase